MKLSKDFKPVVFPLVSIVFIIAMTVWTGNFLLDKINTLRSQSRIVEAKNEILSNRLTTLQSAQNSVNQNFASISLALPPSNPSILATNTVKRAAAANSVSIKNLAVQSLSLPAAAENTEAPDPTVTAVSTIQISLKIESDDVGKLDSFIRQISTSRPVMNLQSISVDGNKGDKYEADIVLNGYYSPYPQYLPALDQPLEGLTPDEQNTLLMVETFSAPDFASFEGEPVVVPPRADPFVLDI